jgi:3-oxoacyl-[acyl-carrier protein] reductase
MLLEGKNAVVTGTNRGIGRAILETFASQGASVYAHARRETPEFMEETRILAEKYGVEIWPLFFDMVDYGAMKSAVREIMSSKRCIDILVNNAGAVADSSSFMMTSMEKIKFIFEINFFAQITLTQYIARIMTRKKSGSIINISSISAIDGDPGQLEYVASKAAVIGASKKLSVELGEYNIRVNTVAPGVTRTDMSGMIEANLRDETIGKTVMKRIASTDEIAGAVLFLASDMSSYVTGQVIRVDGGLR